MFDFLKKKNETTSLKEAEKPQSITVVIVTASDGSEMFSQDLIPNALKEESSFRFVYDHETQKENLLDTWESGLGILKKHKADILLRISPKKEIVCLHFQTERMYQNRNIPFFSPINSLCLPVSYFINQTIPAQILNLIKGICIVLGPQNDTFDKYLERITYALSRNKLPENINGKCTASILFFLALVYMRVRLYDFQKRDFKAVLALIKNAFKNSNSDDLVMQGILYTCLGQLYQISLNDNKGDACTLIEQAIKSFETATKYLNRYVFIYDNGRLALILSDLYCRLFKLRDDNQALRDAIACLRQAEQIYTLSGHPFIWAMIQDKLGDCLSLLSAKSANKEIAVMAIEYLKNKQKVYSKTYAPDMWAETSLKIGAIYDHLGRQHFNLNLTDQALDYYYQALEVFESMNNTFKVNETKRTIARANDILKYHIN